jgi:hypothetical protein
MHKLIAKNELRELEVEILSTPVVNFDEVELTGKNGEIIHVLGSHKWQRLETSTDLTPIFGEQFEMESSRLKIDGCYACSDHQLYFRNATFK